MHDELRGKERWHGACLHYFRMRHTIDEGQCSDSRTSHSTTEIGSRLQKRKSKGIGCKCLVGSTTGTISRIVGSNNLQNSLSCDLVSCTTLFQRYFSFKQISFQVHTISSSTSE